MVDDGSTDETPRVTAELQGEFPELVVIRQENAGLPAARNTGIRRATQRYVAFLDADDEWHPEMLEVLTREFAAQPATTPAVACDSYRVDPGGAAIGEKVIATPGDRFYSAADILMKTRFMPSTVVARRDGFEKAGMFDPELRSSEDRDMWIRLAAAHGNIRYVDRPLVRICRHGANMSRNTGRMRTAMNRVRRKAWAQKVAPHWRVDYWLQTLAVDQFSAGWMYWDEGRKGRAIMHAMLSLALWPLPMDHRAVREPAGFRVRAAARFIIRGVIRGGIGHGE